MLTEITINIRIFKIDISVCPFFEVNMLKFHILRPTTIGSEGNGFGYDTSHGKVSNTIKPFAVSSKHSNDTLGSNIFCICIYFKHFFQLSQCLTFVETCEHMAPCVQLGKTGKRFFQDNFIFYPTLIKMALNYIVYKGLFQPITRFIISSRRVTSETRN